MYRILYEKIFYTPTNIYINTGKVINFPYKTKFLNNFVDKGELNKKVTIAKLDEIVIVLEKSSPKNVLEIKNTAPDLNFVDKICKDPTLPYL